MENPPKVNRTVPYRAVPCSGKAPRVDLHTPLNTTEPVYQGVLEQTRDKLCRTLALPGAGLDIPDLHQIKIMQNMTNLDNVLILSSIFSFNFNSILTICFSLKRFLFSFYLHSSSRMSESAAPVMTKSSMPTRVTRGAAAQANALAKVTQVSRVQRAKARTERRHLARNPMQRQNRVREQVQRRTTRNSFLHQPCQRNICH